LTLICRIGGFVSAEVKKLDGFAWAIIIGACALSLGVILLLDNIGTNGYAYVAGQFLVYAATVSYAVFYTTLKKYGRIAYVNLFAAMFAAMMVGYSFHHENQREEAVGMLDRISELQQEVLNNSIDKAGMPVLNAVPIEQTSEAVGATREVELFARRLMQTEVDLHNEYLEELINSGLEDLLAAEALAKEGGLAENLENIPNLRRIVEKHRTKYFGFFDGIPDAVRESSMLASTQNQFIEGFDGNYNVKRRLLSQQWDYEFSIIDNYDSMLNTLEAASGLWKIEGDQLLFEDDSTLEKYNGLSEALKQLIADQDKVLQELVAINQKALERAKRKLQ